MKTITKKDKDVSEHIERFNSKLKFGVREFTCYLMIIITGLMVTIFGFTGLDIINIILGLVMIGSSFMAFRSLLKLKFSEGAMAYLRMKIEDQEQEHE